MTERRQMHRKSTSRPDDVRSDFPLRRTYFLIASICFVLAAAFVLRRLDGTGIAAMADASPALGGTDVVRVRYGDNLSNLARRYGVTVGNIRRWNYLNDAAIYPGQKLTIYR